ncbi:DUF7314 family protein [Halorarum salinum]|uniref:DUF7314 domain-containing protein n=1 Tax=Halorarum salinum TaxID=2743089 RepID=A0A7D5LCA1_9EURY|nr:hypothetical protein [Halobaculum salinum]QLG63128.1 hypothetical protein HUG12_15865 [Halobaculum salinum]
MADEFIKGLGLLTGGGLAWMVLASWYRTESFESTHQLIAAPPEPANVFDAIGIFLNDVFLWTAVLGALTFWVLVPAVKELGAAYDERRSS